jgi:hypothetical protein
MGLVIGHHGMRNVLMVGPGTPGWQTTFDIAEYCMVLGIPGLANAKEVNDFIVRMDFYEALYGTRGLSRSEIRLRIGLTTNVPRVPRKTWGLRISNRYFEEKDRTLKVDSSHAST